MQSAGTLQQYVHYHFVFLPRLPVAAALASASAFHCWHTFCMSSPSFAFVSVAGVAEFASSQFAATSAVLPIAIGDNKRKRKRKRKRRKRRKRRRTKWQRQT